MYRFKTLKNAQDITSIVSIFANNKPISTLQSEHPYCIVLVGAPGVGKTTQVARYLDNIDLDYDHFYHISLDSLVEKVKPYRNTSLRIYSTLKNKNNVGILNSLYLPTIMSHNTNFSLKATEKARMKKIKGAGKRKRTLKSLNELREEGFIYGVQNGLNIIYDTTLSSSTDKIRKNIMPIIEMSPVKYNIKVMLVTANEDIIKKRLKERQNGMISKNYIRAINPKAIEKLISENEKGFEMFQKYMKEGDYEKNINTRYNADDFEFIVIDNSKNRSERR